MKLGSGHNHEHKIIFNRVFQKLKNEKGVDSARVVEDVYDKLCMGLSYWMSRPEMPKIIFPFFGTFSPSIKKSCYTLMYMVSFTKKKRLKMLSNMNESILRIIKEKDAKSRRSKKVQSRSNKTV